MLTRAQKQVQIELLQEKLGRATGLVALDYRGLTVQQTDALRGVLRGAGPGAYEYRVTKNTLLVRAAQGTPLEPFATLCSGPTALGIAYDEPGALAKILVEFGKQNEKLSIRGGFVDGALIDAKGIDALAKLPGKHELRGMLAGTLQAPLRNLAGTLYGLLGNLRNALEQRQDQLESAAPAVSGEASPSE